MRNGTYRIPYDKTHRRLRSILRRMEFDITHEDLNSGTITAKRKGDIFTPGIILEIVLIKVDDESTQLKVKTSALKHVFKVSMEKLGRIEERILHGIA